MNDLKSGYLLKTDPRQQILGEGIGGVIGAILSVFVLLIMKSAFGGFGTAELPAPQAPDLPRLHVQDPVRPVFPEDRNSQLGTGSLDPGEIIRILQDIFHDL
jgi:hypothetical protein